MAWEIKKNLPHVFFLLSEFNVSENTFSQNDINNVIYHEMFIFIGCYIRPIFEKGACRWEQHARQLQMLRCCKQPGKDTSLIQFS